MSAEFPKQPEAGDSTSRPDLLESQGRGKGHTAGDADGNQPFPDVEPMTLSILGRLFGVPLLIISVIVVGAALVVMLFGAPAASESRSVDELLQALEAGSGEGSLGILLPKEKELWQTALELAMRLENKEDELTEEELSEAARRISQTVLTDLGMVDQVVSAKRDRETHVQVRSKRLEFLIRALGRTGRPEAVAPLVTIVRSGREPFVRVAIEQLGNLHRVRRARAAAGDILDVLRGSPPTETRLVAHAALSVLADPSDEEVIGALANERLLGEGEVAWSSALALARLGDASGKVTLFDMLNRTFWETGDRYQVTEESGRTLRYPMQPGRIDTFLIATIEACTHLTDEEIWQAISALTRDRSPSVQAAALRALKNRAS